MKKQSITCATILKIDDYSIICERVENNRMGCPQFVCQPIINNYAYRVKIATYGGEFQACEIALEKVLDFRSK